MKAAAAGGRSKVEVPKGLTILGFRHVAMSHSTPALEIDRQSTVNAAISASRPIASQIPSAT